MNADLSAQSACRHCGWFKFNHFLEGRAKTQMFSIYCLRSSNLFDCPGFESETEEEFQKKLQEEIKKQELRRQEGVT